MKPWRAPGPAWLVVGEQKRSRRQREQGFPGGAVVENPPASAGHMSSSPGLGRSPHAAKQLSPRATATEARAPRARKPQLLKPTHLEPVLHNKRSHRDEKPCAHRN